MECETVSRTGLLLDKVFHKTKQSAQFWRQYHGDTSFLSVFITWWTATFSRHYGTLLVINKCNQVHNNERQLTFSSFDDNDTDLLSSSYVNTLPAASCVLAHSEFVKYCYNRTGYLWGLTPSGGFACHEDLEKIHVISYLGSSTNTNTS
jgi:hypothetical protein